VVFASFFLFKLQFLADHLRAFLALVDILWAYHVRSFGLERILHAGEVLRTACVSNAQVNWIAVKCGTISFHFIYLQTT